MQVSYFKSENGKCPIQEFLDSLDNKQQSKVLRYFLLLKQYGLTPVMPHVKKLTGTPLWEIRILGKDSIRIIYFSPHKESIVILHGFLKKTKKTPPKELSIALKRYYQCLDT